MRVPVGRPTRGLFVGITSGQIPTEHAIVAYHHQIVVSAPAGFEKDPAALRRPLWRAIACLPWISGTGSGVRKSLGCTACDRHDPNSTLARVRQHPAVGRPA